MAEVDDAGGSASTGHAQGVRTPAFRRLWWSWTISLLGDGVRGLALPLYVIIETRSALATSAVAAAEVLPWLLCALPAGAVVDRSNPRLVVTIAHTFRAVATGGLVACIVTDNAPLAVLCAFAFTLTVAETFAYSASQALMVSLAGPDELNEANAKFYTVHTIGLNLAGPLAAGALFALGPAWAFTLDGLTFVVAAILVSRLPSIAPAAHDPKRVRKLRGDVREGIQLLFRTRGLRILVLMIATSTLAISAVNTLTPFFAVQRLHMAPVFVSTLLVAGALGSLLGAQLAARVARQWPEGRVLVVSILVFAGGMIALGAFPFAVAALTANALIGVGVGAFNVIAAARRQRLTPAAAMGRISGAYRMVAWGLMPLGAGLAGPLAVITSLSAVFVIAGALVLVALTLLGRPLLRANATVPAPRDGSTGQSVGPDDSNSQNRSAAPTRRPSAPA